MDGVRPRPSGPNEGRWGVRDGVSRILCGSDRDGSGGSVGDRGVQTVQDVLVAGADPVVSSAASAMARVRLSRSYRMLEPGRERETRGIGRGCRQTKKNLLIAAELSYLEWSKC